MIIYICALLVFPKPRSIVQLRIQTNYCAFYRPKQMMQNTRPLDLVWRNLQLSKSEISDSNIAAAVPWNTLNCEVRVKF